MPALTVVSVVASDMDASVTFYSSLGLQVTEGDATSDHVTFAGEGVRLMLDTETLIRQIDPDWIRPVGGHAVALAFECASPAEVDAAFARLRAGGADVRREPWDAFWGQRYATVCDPDGNQIDLFAALDAE